ncbi:MAG: PilZ domain-containing protein [Pseudobdellovibrionaceae bacterium]
MNQTLPRYIQRAPRYTLQANERTLVRYAGPKRLPWEEGTEIQDISLSGLAFTAPEELAPSLGEPIKVEFVEPGGRQLACLARVTRVEKKKDMVLVACEFEDLFSAQKFMLSQSLNKKLKDQKRQVENHVFRLALILLFQNKKKVALLFLSLCLFATVLSLMFF